MTQEEILETLVQNPHSLFDVKFLQTVNTAFNTKIRATHHYADLTSLRLNIESDPDDGTRELGIACFHLAQKLCEELNVTYPSRIGRRLQVRACVKELRVAGFGHDLLISPRPHNWGEGEI